MKTQKNQTYRGSWRQLYALHKKDEGEHRETIYILLFNLIRAFISNDWQGSSESTGEQHDSPPVLFPLYPVMSIFPVWHQAMILRKGKMKLACIDNANGTVMAYRLCR